jgi:lysophospholipase L1-like esterase
MSATFRIFSIFLLAVAVFSGILFSFFQNSRVIDRPRTGENVIAFGDSLVQGIGATPGNDFPSVLSRRLGVSIMNAGATGDTTASALARLDSSVLTKNPRVVIVLLGGNDVLRRLPSEEAFENLGEIIDRVHGSGAAVLLLGVRGTGIFADRYEDGFRELAKRKNVSFVSNILDGIFGDDNLMSGDGIHPNDRGYAVMADKIEPVIRDMLRR